MIKTSLTGKVKYEVHSGSFRVGSRRERRDRAAVNILNYSFALLWCNADGLKSEAERPDR